MVKACRTVIRVAPSHAYHYRRRRWTQSPAVIKGHDYTVLELFLRILQLLKIWGQVVLRFQRACTWHALHDNYGSARCLRQRRPS
jgi:hypothetical protein